MSKMTFLCVASLAFALAHGCLPRKFNQGAVVRQNQSTEGAVEKVPVFAFWDGGRQGLEGTLLQKHNVNAFTKLSDSRRFETHLVHMNPKEYVEGDGNFFMEILDRSDYPAEFFGEATLDADYRALVGELVTAATPALRKNFPDEHVFADKLQRYKDAVHFRAYVASKMSKNDLIQNKSKEFQQKNFTAKELYGKAAVPMSDLVRLALLCKYGGIWVDSTVSMNTDLAYFYDELDKSGKSLFLYYNFMYMQDAKTFREAAKAQGKALNPEQIKALRSVSGGETWWLVSKGKGHPLLKAWLDEALRYWTLKEVATKVPANGTTSYLTPDLTAHPSFASGPAGTPRVDINKIPAQLRNYLWIYLLWAKVTLERQQEALASVDARSAFENLLPFKGGKNGIVGPYVYMLGSNLQNADWSARAADVFLPVTSGRRAAPSGADETSATADEDLIRTQGYTAGAEIPEEAKRLPGNFYTRWIDQMKMIKVPGETAKDLKAVYGDDAGLAARKSVFTYIWEKKRASTEAQTP